MLRYDNSSGCCVRFSLLHRAEGMPCVYLLVGADFFFLKMRGTDGELLKARTPTKPYSYRVS